VEQVGPSVFSRLAALSDERPRGLLAERLELLRLLHAPGGSGVSSPPALDA
jgi:hypothetical protein